jgi:hypothetical protein
MVMWNILTDTQLFKVVFIIKRCSDHCWLHVCKSTNNSIVVLHIFYHN